MRLNLKESSNGITILPPCADPPAEKTHTEETETKILEKASVIYNSRKYYTGLTPR